MFVDAYSYEALHYAGFSSLLSLHHSYVQIFFSAPCSHTPSICVLPFIPLEAKAHLNNIKIQLPQRKHIVFPLQR
jgi:hypothetical protein